MSIDLRLSAQLLIGELREWRSLQEGLARRIQNIEGYSIIGPVIIPPSTLDLEITFGLDGAVPGFIFLQTPSQVGELIVAFESIDGKTVRVKPRHGVVIDPSILSWLPSVSKIFVSNGNEFECLLSVLLTKDFSGP